jgi:hypothetical protein
MKAQILIRRFGAQLYSDPRRVTARELTAIIDAHSARIYPHFRHKFDSKFVRIHGSTARDTHEARSSDFDVGLLPLKRTKLEDARRPLGEFAVALGRSLASDHTVCDRMAWLFGCERTEVQAAFRSPFEKARKDGLNSENPILTFQFVLREGGKHLIEISTGISGWHRGGLLYSAIWNLQMECVPDARRVVCDVLLLKALMKKRGCHGKGGGGLNSRGLEQLVIYFALQGEEHPLHAAMEQIQGLALWKDWAGHLFYPIPEDLWKDLELPLPRRDFMNGTSLTEEGLEKFRNLARDVISGDPQRVGDCLA